MNNGNARIKIEYVENFMAAAFGSVGVPSNQGISILLFGYHRRKTAPATSESIIGRWRNIEIAAALEGDFLGPAIGDETIDDIARAASKLSGLERMAFAATRISREGEQRLRTRLTNVEIKVFIPVLTPSLRTRR